MRKVVVQGTPPEDWVEKAKVLEEKLRVAKTSDERAEVIKKHQSLWRDDRILNWLLKQFNDKCWYSEARDTGSPIHVDHFRPKGRVKGADGSYREGYWWLAFEWTNYRICCHLLNSKKSDLFPIIEGDCAKQDNALSLKFEAPVLIDPTSDSTRLISYERDEFACKAVPAASIAVLDRKRADDTIDIIGLNRPPALGRKRADYWDACRMRIAEYVNADGPQVFRLINQTAAKVRLKEMINYNAEFSSVAEACIRKNAPEPLVALVFEQNTVHT